jgi:hypothetical protein
MLNWEPYKAITSIMQTGYLIEIWIRVLGN